MDEKKTDKRVQMAVNFIREFVSHTENERARELVRARLEGLVGDFVSLPAGAQDVIISLFIILSQGEYRLTDGELFAEALRDYCGECSTIGFIARKAGVGREES